MQLINTPELVLAVTLLLAFTKWTCDTLMMKLMQVLIPQSPLDQAKISELWIEEPNNYFTH